MAYVSGAEEATSGDFRSTWGWNEALLSPYAVGNPNEGGYMEPINLELVDGSRRLLSLMGKNRSLADRASVWLGILVLSFIMYSVIVRPTKAAQTFEYGKEATIDQHGNIYVSSNEGKLIKVADTSHCAEAGVAADKQTVGCFVMQPPTPDGSWISLDLEIYLKGGRRVVIDPGTPMGNWHFWNGGQQVAICSYRPGRPIMHILYDSATGQVVERVEGPSDDSLLPQWAKNSLQISNDSVLSSPVLAQERTKWITKVLYQTGKIRPGMRRKDLLKLFTTEGGLSTNRSRTYVLVECPYIKVDVQFKPGSNGSDEDIIESLSKPYLAWGVMD